MSWWSKPINIGDHVRVSKGPFIGWTGTVSGRDTDLLRVAFPVSTCGCCGEIERLWLRRADLQRTER